VTALQLWEESEQGLDAANEGSKRRDLLQVVDEADAGFPPSTASEFVQRGLPQLAADPLQSSVTSLGQTGVRVHDLNEIAVSPLATWINLPFNDLATPTDRWVFHVGQPHLIRMAENRIDIEGVGCQLQVRGLAGADYWRDHVGWTWVRQRNFYCLFAESPIGAPEPALDMRPSPEAASHASPSAVEDGSVPRVRALTAVTDLAAWLDLPIADVMKLAGLAESTYHYWRSAPTGLLRRGKTQRLFRLHAAVGLVVTAQGEAAARMWFESGDPSPHGVLRSERRQRSHRSDEAMDIIERLVTRVWRTAQPEAPAVRPRVPTENDLNILLGEIVAREADLIQQEGPVAFDQEAESKHGRTRSSPGR